MTHTITFQWSSSAGASKSVTSTSGSGASETSITETIPAESTNLAVACAIDQSALKSLFINIDKAATIVAKAAGGATVNTWTMAANVPLAWQDGNANACPLSGDIATLEVTTGAVGDAVLDVRVLQDPTPA